MEIEKMIVYLKDGPIREYTWNENHLTMQELIAMVNMVNKVPQATWIKDN